MQTQHKELIWTFKEVISIEASIRRKIITYVDMNNITDLHNFNTNSIKKTINVIQKHLFDAYNKITPHMITEHEYVVEHMNFDVDTPIDTVSTDLK